MEDDDIRLDTQVAQLPDALFEMVLECRVETLEIPVPLRLALVGVIYRLVHVINVILGENTHPYFIERRVFQRLQRLLLHLITLMHPGITGGTDRKVRCTISIGELRSIVDTDRTMVARFGLCAGELTLRAVGW